MTRSEFDMVLRQYNVIFLNTKDKIEWPVSCLTIVYPQKQECQKFMISAVEKRNCIQSEVERGDHLETY